MQPSYASPRLILQLITIKDAEFIMQLVNTTEWIKYIGNRNINTTEQARAYIQKIIDNPDINYWVIKIQEQQIPIGIISFIKRAYLPSHDIGFAFLNEYKNQGYGFEAASIVLHDALQQGYHKQVLATTVKENTRSIQLLQKLGFSFFDEIVHEQQPLFVFKKTAGK